MLSTPCLIRDQCAKLSAPSLSDAYMEAMAREENQKLVDSEIEEISNHINGLFSDLLHF